MEEEKHHTGNGFKVLSGFAILGLQYNTVQYNTVAYGSIIKYTSCMQVH